MLNRILFPIFKKSARVLSGKGFTRFPPFRIAASFLFKNLAQTFVEINGKERAVYQINFDGLKMFVFPGDTTVSRLLIIKGDFNELETGVFKQYVRKGMTVVDIGAHVGHSTVILANLVGNEGKVYAFEGNPVDHALLKKNMEINNFQNTVIEKKIVSEKAKKLDLKCKDIKFIHRSCDPHEDSKTTELEFITLNNYFKKKKVDFLKMDIWGGEIKALKGMLEMLKRNKNIVLATEFWPNNIEVAGQNPDEYLDILENLGFKFSRINKESGLVEPVSKEEAMKIGREENHINLLCMRNPA